MSSKVVVVTGAGRGLGAEIARQCAREGARVVLAGRTVHGLESVRDEILADGGRALVQPTDILDPQSVQSLFAATKDEFGTFDVLVNNAGITAHVNLVDLQEDEWDRVFDTNVRGMFLCSREAGRHFARDAGPAAPSTSPPCSACSAGRGSPPTARPRARSSTSREPSPPSGHGSAHR